MESKHNSYILQQLMQDKYTRIRQAYFPLFQAKETNTLAKPIKDRTAPELLTEFQFTEQELVARGLKPKLMKLDNEASKLLKDYLYQQDITFQLVPP
jgi:hypothetical protein